MRNANLVLEHLREFAIFYMFSQKWKMRQLRYGAGSQSRGNGRVFPGPEMPMGTKDLLRAKKPWLGHVEGEKE